MPRNFSELKSGGTIPMLSPHPEKWGGASPRPPPIDARAGEHYVTTTEFGHHTLQRRIVARFSVTQDFPSTINRK